VTSNLGSPDHLVVLANPKGGSDIAAALPQDWILQECPPEELEPRLRGFASAGLKAVGVAGGDGTLRTAAHVLAGGSTALACLPGGTRNHFARLLGTGDMDAVQAAVRARSTMRVDLGRCDDLVFVNNASFGWYTDFVQSRDELVDRGLSKRVAHWLAPFRVLRRHRDLEVQIGDTTHSTWMVWVGNGEFGLTPSTLNTRPLPTTGVLDVRFVRSDAFLAKFRLLLALLFHRLNRSPLLVRTVTPAVRLRFNAPRVQAALDGELMAMGAEIAMHSDPGQLLVFVGAAAGGTK
jgi:diacylglycerol kinase family enzyme